MFNIDDASKKSKEAMDTMLKNYSEVTKGFQAIAAEATDYSKKSFQDLTSFIKSSYESFVAEATKMGEMYADLAKIAYKPYESSMAKTMAPVSAAA